MLRHAPAARIALAAALAVAPAATAQPTSMDFATIGDPGNIGYDRPMADGRVSPLSGRGVVDYEFRISKQEVSTIEWLTFYNTFAEQDPALGTLLQPSTWGARQIFPGSTVDTRAVLRDNLSFAADMPIAVSFRQAARYLNWLHNGKSSDPSAIESGVYDTSTFTENPDGSRNDQIDPSPGARFRLPTTDEFIKAAHYDPDKNGQGPGWWLYGHSSDELPVSGLPGEGDTISGVPDDVVEAAFEGASHRAVPLGVYPDVQSPWGLINVIDGREEVFGDLTNLADGGFERTRGREGWLLRNSPLQITDEQQRMDEAFDPLIQPTGTGYSFRIVTAIPSPGTGFAVVALTPGLLWRRKRA